MLAARAYRLIVEPSVRENNHSPVASEISALVQFRKSIQPALAMGAQVILEATNLKKLWKDAP
jgi:hypothetical protein